MRDMDIRKYYDLKHVAQMRVAITNVMEATLESAFQLILQLYIVGTHYTELDQVRLCVCLWVCRGVLVCLSTKKKN